MDAHVGKNLFQNAIVTAMRNRGHTVILVTHALHFLRQCDYIYTMNNGRITEQGTYEQLIVKGGEFARLDKEFGGQNEDRRSLDSEATAEEEFEAPKVNIESVKMKSEGAGKRGEGTGKAEGKVCLSPEKYIGGS